MLYNDISTFYKMTLQDEATSIMCGIKDLHDNILFYLLYIIIVVTYFLIVTILQKTTLSVRSKDLNHNSLLEFIWTIIPTIILIIIGIPSFKLLYSMDQEMIPLLTLKIIGSQWYWNYELFNVYGKNIEFSSYLNEDYNVLKYLETDNAIYLPVLTPIKLLISATDVIHSWALPSLGIKMDSIPGRINALNLYLLREGTFYGQCSELCGLGHSYMPIELNSVSLNTFIKYINQM